MFCNSLLIDPDTDSVSSISKLIAKDKIQQATADNGKMLNIEVRKNVTLINHFRITNETTNTKSKEMRVRFKQMTNLNAMDNRSEPIFPYGNRCAYVKTYNQLSQINHWAKLIGHDQLRIPVLEGIFCRNICGSSWLMEMFNKYFQCNCPKYF